VNPWTAWQPWVIGGIAVAVMMWFVVRALFADKARGRPRCLRCGHPFIESQGLICTECGWTARRPADLLRTRRHWGKATLAVAVMLAGAVTVRLIALGGNPLSILPSRLLVALMPLDPTDQQGHGPIAEALRRRIVNEDLSTGTVAALVEVVVAGDAAAVPPSDAWVRRYGLLADELRARHAPRESPNHARLLELPPRIEVETPLAWPADEPVPGSMTIRDWWPEGAEAIVTLRADGDEHGDSEAAWHRVGYRNRASIRRRHHFTLPPPSTWPESNAMQATLEVRTTDPEAAVAAEPGVWDAAEIAATVNAGVTVDRPEDLPRPDLMPWPGDEETNAMVAAVFRDGLRRWPGTTRPFAIRFNPRRLQVDDLAGVHFGFVVEIVERLPSGDEVVRRRTRIWMPGGSSRGWRQRAGWTISEEDTAGLAGAFDEDSESVWLMRITGDESLASLSAAIEGATPVVAGAGVRAGVAAGAGQVGVGTTDITGGTADDTPDRVGDGAGAETGRWWSGTVERPLRVESAEGSPFVRMWFRPEGVAPPAPRR